ncbi:hypothetical protein PF049_03820 [Erythrobacteraceae bacterium WH01K]|nr:hypothetical protein PF049_03820 [Erythrobacteraceae bacterium WH01K]
MAEPDERFCKAIAVRLFRLWSMAREEGVVTLERMHEVASELRLPDETAPACASLFALIEAQLERPLVRECCCSRRFSSDESALLGVLEAAPSLGGRNGNSTVPHGLPGAVHWAAMAVRRALEWPEREIPAPTNSQASCPFNAVKPSMSNAI